MLNRRTVNFLFFLLILISMLCDVFGTVSPWIYVVIGVCYSLLQVYGSAILSAQFFLPVKFKGEKTAGTIAITFDDGPVPEKTEKVLSILKRYEVPAAFFCIGHRVKANPALVKRIHDEGHVLGNHSYWHGKMFDLQSASVIASELKQTDQVISAYAGVTPRFFRPPYGVTNPMVAAAVKVGGYVTIGWSVRSLDTVIKNSTKLLDRVTSSLKAGDVIIFHDHSDSMLEILPSLLDHIQKVGLKIVRIDELLNEKAYV